MNTMTGEIYEGGAAIAAALDRGEPVVPVSDRVAKFMQLGQQASEEPLTALNEIKSRLEKLEGADNE